MADRMVWLRSSLSAIAIVAFGVITPAPAQGQTSPAAETVCVACHANATWESHRLAGHATSTTCLTCHHIGFSNDPAVVTVRRLEACSACHADLPAAHESKEGAVATCTDCHTIHADTAVTGPDLVSDAACESCHAVRHTLHAVVKEGAPSCTECHTLHDGATPGASVVSNGAHAASAAWAESAVTKCETCHEGVHPSHAVAAREGQLPCTTCHEMDATPTTAVVPALLSAQCGRCHATVRRAHASVGDVVLCTDCHDFATDPPLASAGPAMSRQCAACHADALKAFDSGGHAVKLTAGAVNQELPTCVSCHDVHDASEQTGVGVRLAATVRCIQCHSKPVMTRKYGLSTNVAASYVDDFHGTTAAVLSSRSVSAEAPNVLVCSDCHGAHAVTEKPKETISAVWANVGLKSQRSPASAWWNGWNTWEP